MVIVLLIVYLLIKILFLGVGIGVGFLLHWMLPAVDLGIGVLIGVVTTAVAVHFFMRLMQSLNEFQEEETGQKAKAKLGTYSLDSLTSRKKMKQKSST